MPPLAYGVALAGMVAAVAFQVPLPQLEEDQVLQLNKRAGKLGDVVANDPEDVWPGKFVALNLNSIKAAADSSLEANVRAEFAAGVYRAAKVNAETFARAAHEAADVVVVKSKEVIQSSSAAVSTAADLGAPMAEVKLTNGAQNATALAVAAADAAKITSASIIGYKAAERNASKASAVMIGATKTIVANLDATIAFSRDAADALGGSPVPVPFPSLSAPAAGREGALVAAGAERQGPTALTGVQIMALAVVGAALAATACWCYNGPTGA